MKPRQNERKQCHLFDSLQMSSFSILNNLLTKSIQFFHQHCHICSSFKFILTYSSKRNVSCTSIVTIHLQIYSHIFTRNVLWILHIATLLNKYHHGAQVMAGYPASQSLTKHIFFSTCVLFKKKHINDNIRYCNRNMVQIDLKFSNCKKEMLNMLKVFLRSSSCTSTYLET